MQGRANVDMSKSRLKWQCRRGMRELDDLLMHWLETRFDSADASHKQAFESLLALSDPEIAAYLLKKESPLEPVGLIVHQILHPDSR